MQHFGSELGGAGIGVVFGGLTMAVIFMGLAQWVGTMYSVGFFNHQFSGHEWSGIGFLIGFLFTPKKSIENRKIVISKISDFLTKLSKISKFSKNRGPTLSCHIFF